MTWQLSDLDRRISHHLIDDSTGSAGSFCGVGELMVETVFEKLLEISAKVEMTTMVSGWR